MLVNGIDMDTFLTHLRKLVMSAVIKQSKHAKEYETKDTKLAGDKYVAAIETGGYWSSYVQFDKRVLIRAGVPTLLIPKAMADKENIPVEYRERCIQLQRNYNISIFKERNNYYRMLNGKPDIGDKDFVYAPPNNFGIPTDVPVHDLDPSHAHTLTASGIGDALVKKYPEKKYLKFLGPYGIPYYNARVAKNYDLLYIVPTDQDFISNEFIKSYNEARDYVMLGLYTQNDNRLYEFYDEFMGFLVMIIAIQRFLAKIFKQGITRDFFDDALIRHLYEGYNMPYFEDIAIKYQRIIAKDLNLLLQMKSSNQGLYDITGIFNFVKVNIYKYYLVKDYKKDAKGNPIIKHKMVVDENGNSKEVIDYHNTFDIWFQKVNIRNMDPAAAIADPSNKEDFWSITGGDPYWINDSDLLEKIYRNNFNSIITKYMGIDIIYSMTKTVYESMYDIRMMIDNQDETKELKINLTKLTPNYVNLYELVIFLSALVSSRFGLKGEIPLKGYQIANVYGFNFKADLAKIREDINSWMRELMKRGTTWDAYFNRNHLKYPNLETGRSFYNHWTRYIDPEILKFFTKTHTPTINDIDVVYHNTDALRKFLDWAMRTTPHLETYQAYKHLYDSLLITEDVKELYRKPNGEYGNSYLDLLYGIRPDLAEIVERNKGNIKAINELIDYLLGKLGKLSDSFKFIPSLNEKGDLIRTIAKLINEFKSYTVSDAHGGIVYIMDDPHFNLLKILDRIDSSNTDLTIDDRTALRYIYEDCISRIKVSLKYDDKIQFTEEPIMVTSSILRQYIKLKEKIQLISKDILINDEATMQIEDLYANISKEFLLDPNNKEYLHLLNEVYRICFTEFREELFISDMILWDLLVEETLTHELDLFNSVTDMKTSFMRKLTIMISEYYLSKVVVMLKEQIKFIHTWSYSEPIDVCLDTTIDLMNTMTSTEDLDASTVVEIKEWYTRVLWLPRNDRITLLHRLLFDTTTIRPTDNLYILSMLLVHAIFNLPNDKLTTDEAFYVGNTDFDTFIQRIHLTWKMMYKKYQKITMDVLIDSYIDIMTRESLSSTVTYRDSYRKTSTFNHNEAISMGRESNSGKNIMVDSNVCISNGSRRKGIKNIQTKPIRMKHYLKKTYSE